MIGKLFCSIARGLGGCECDSIDILPTGTHITSTAEKAMLLDKWFPGVQQFLTYQYVLPSYDDIALFLAQDQTNKYDYVFPDYLCSHYAMRLAGQFSIPGWSNLTFGLCWTDKHALNCVITQDKEFYFVEPQTDTLQDKLEPWQGSTLRFIMI